MNNEYFREREEMNEIRFRVKSYINVRGLSSPLRAAKLAAGASGVMDQ